MSLAENRRQARLVLDEHRCMLELRLRSGQIVSFDGRIVEVFSSNGGGARLHIAKIDPARAVEPDGASTVVLAEPGVLLYFTPEEALARDRLLAAISDARRADEQLGARDRL